jgi:hypothetical protein
MNNWKLYMKWLKLRHQEQTLPVMFKDFGGYGQNVKPYSDTKANSLTRAIVDLFTFIGGDANRVSSAGRYDATRKRFITSQTRKGTADIHAILEGQHISIEVKIGRDRMSDYQHKEAERIRRAGGIYFVATNMAMVLEWLDASFIGVLPVAPNDLKLFFKQAKVQATIDDAARAKRLKK